jgi:hypothetical protein
MGICGNEKAKSRGLQGFYFTNRILLSLVLFSFSSACLFFYIQGLEKSEIFCENCEVWAINWGLVTRKRLKSGFFGEIEFFEGAWFEVV